MDLVITSEDIAVILELIDHRLDELADGDEKDELVRLFDKLMKAHEELNGVEQ